jgi:hypothetical protein
VTFTYLGVLNWTLDLVAIKLYREQHVILKAFLLLRILSYEVILFLIYIMA